MGVKIIIVVVLCSAFTNGAPSTELLRYQQTEVKVSSKALELLENIIKNEIYTNLVKTYLGLTPDYAAVSCKQIAEFKPCLLYTSPSPRDATLSRMPSSA